jgi:predicted dehydrogenase
MSKKLRLGIIGGGGDSLIGVLHRIASFMNDNYEIVGGVFNPNWDENIGFATEIDIPTDRIYETFDIFVVQEMQLPEEDRIEVVAVLTPNFLHFPMAKKLIENGFHVICEKPMTTTEKEALALEKALEKSNTVFAVTYTYTGYPMARQMREMIRSGQIGKLQRIDIQYYQGWINEFIHDLDKRKTIWRLDPEKAGLSSCMGDIGTHAFNMAEYLTGKSIKSILADLNYLYEDNPVDIDGTVLLRYDDELKGVLRVSQIATGEENGLQVKIYGRKGSLKWEQENPNFVYHKPEIGPMQVYKPGHAYNSPLSLEVTKLPPGHPEGIFDAMANIYLGVAKAVRGEQFDSGEFPTMNDGVRGAKFIERCIASHKNGNVWTEI